MFVSAGQQRRKLKSWRVLVGEMTRAVISGCPHSLRVASRTQVNLIRTAVAFYLANNIEIVVVSIQGSANFGGVAL